MREDEGLSIEKSLPWDRSLYTVNFLESSSLMPLFVNLQFWGKLSQFHFRKKKKINLGFCLFVLEAGFELELSSCPRLVESKVFSSVVVFLFVKSKKGGNLLYRSIIIKNNNNEGFFIINIIISDLG